VVAGNPYAKVGKGSFRYQTEGLMIQVEKLFIQISGTVSRIERSINPFASFTNQVGVIVF
jgi:hypothetical protein